MAKDKLKTYQVRVTYCGEVTFDIWAENEEDAKEVSVTYAKSGEALSARHYISDIKPEIVGESVL